MVFNTIGYQTIATQLVAKHYEEKLTRGKIKQCFYQTPVILPEKLIDIYTNNLLYQYIRNIFNIDLIFVNSYLGNLFVNRIILFPLQI
jgi:hypothetical protein